MTIASRPVKVIAPARLHMGFLDLSGSLGRHFGSIGIALNEISTRMVMRRANETSVKGPGSARAEKCLRKLCRTLNVSDKVRIDIASAIPEHVGLGSGTQMALAVGSALSRLYRLDLGVRDIAGLADRGARSGIGIGVFELGGFVLDGGRAEETVTPPVLSRMPIPDAWRFILVFDERGQGLHGQQEAMAFRDLPPFPVGEAARLCYLILMQALPALAECNLSKFGEVITDLQKSVGDHFASAQGGRFTSTDVGRAMNWFEAQGAVAVGQTSWGPTGFCMVESAEAAEWLIGAARRTFDDVPTLRFMIANARNQGGVVEEALSDRDAMAGDSDFFAKVAGN